ncbi:tail protein X [Pseudomonas helleri]|uniref:tail protein X n=1 Tax=Pseudomonas helleri TaxID=1608996 RepID=UPI0006548460|nr:tail protein X [Pseudomonas helleri]KMN09460.1 phage tail protein [Pseudomonas helleri]
MATTCRTASGDVLDTLCQNYYGYLNGTVEAGLDADQGLADEVQPYRAGVVIHMPDVVWASEEGVMLWG